MDIHHGTGAGTICTHTATQGKIQTIQRRDIQRQHSLIIGIYAVKTTCIQKTHAHPAPERHFILHAKVELCTDSFSDAACTLILQRKEILQIIGNAVLLVFKGVLITTDSNIVKTVKSIWHTGVYGRMSSLAP